MTTAPAWPPPGRSTDRDPRRNVLPLDLGPAAALRIYARLGLVAVVIPALVVGLLAAIYATATRAPVIVLICISGCAVAFLSDIAARSLSRSRDQASNPAWTDGGRDAHSRSDEILHEAERSTSPASPGPRVASQNALLRPAQWAQDEARKQVRKTVQSLQREHLLTPRRSRATLNARALAVLAIQSADTEEAAREMYRQAINVKSSSAMHSVLEFAIAFLGEGDTATARELFLHAIGVSRSNAASSGPVS